MVDTILNIDTFDIPESEDIHKAGDRDTATTIVVLNKKDYETHNALLHKIFKAINIDIENDVLLLQLEEGMSCPLNQYVTDATEYVMSFGLGIKALCLNAKFIANSFYKTESYSVMLTHSLTKLSTDNQNKKALWTALQKVFIEK